MVGQQSTQQKGTDDAHRV